MAGHPDDRPARPARPVWAERLRRERVVRGWSQAEAVRALHLHLPADPTGEAGLLHAWRGWEAGTREPGEPYRAALARTFGTVTAAFFPPRPAPVPVPARAGTLEILARLRAPDLDARTLEGLAGQVAELCGQYARAPAEPVLPVALKWQHRLNDLLWHRLTLDQHREVLRLAGFVTLLIGCLEWDRGLSSEAELSRRTAASLGAEAGCADVLGWAHELRAWFALTQGDHRAVIAAAEAGRAAAGAQPVTVQLLAQAAKSWARIGDRRQTEVALDEARRRLDPLPPPERPGDHFAVDPARFDLWAMDCYRVLGEDRLAAGHAREVLSAAAGRSPMREAEAELTLGVVAARSGDVEGAARHGKLALGGERVSLPALLMTSGELARILDRRFAGSPEADGFGRERRRLEAQLLHTGRPWRVDTLTPPA